MSPTTAVGKRIRTRLGRRCHPMALLDLQAMELAADATRGGGRGSNLSVTGCGGKSSLSVIDCF
ncbi:MAG: SapB/AmfS family lantipeptide [Actinobacteria bacterium]|nr:MAG: SapB/AmfS family lantipeptide [Actinomycetota bacterium]